MKRRNLLLISLVSILGMSTIISCGGDNEYDKDGKMILDLRNLYFSDWTSTDVYTEYIQDKFNVKINASSYGWNSWADEVSGAINGNHLSDVFHYDIESFNFGNTYQDWAEGGILKALPTDLSSWPNLKSMLEDVSNINALKLDGKLYGIPVTYNIKNPEKDFSSFTYVYRRDWAKEIDERHKNDSTWVKIYKENDVYTWEEFERLIKAFDNYEESDNYYALGDVEWGFPSLTNFFKDVPHCYLKNNEGKVVNAFLDDKYISGLNYAKNYVDKKYYGHDQYSAKDGDILKDYKAGKCGIYYDNLSLSNYITLRNDFKKNQKLVDLNDGTAILKVKGPDGKFALEGTDNWFSMTMFNSDISDDKMNKILDIIDYLLSEEGTRLATFGLEGYDYELINGEVSLLSTGWEKDSEGKYINKENGAKYLRYMATLGNDTKDVDPLTDKETYDILNNWTQEMSEAKSRGELRVVKEDPEIKWLSCKNKNEKTSAMLSDANDLVMKYCYGNNSVKTIEQFKAAFENDNRWKSVLEEINGLI